MGFNFCRYLRYGSFPVINPKNETFPDSFQHYEPTQENIVILSNNNSFTYELSRPKAGVWFFVTYLAGDSDDKIKQQV